MYKSYTASQNQRRNLSDYERGFRVTLALSMLTAVVGGAVVAPAVIAALSTISVYLVMTAILSLDPVYALVRFAGKQLGAGHGEFVTS